MNQTPHSPARERTDDDADLPAEFDLLAHSVAPVTPPSSLKDRLLASVRAEPTVVRVGETPFEKTDLPGVDTRHLALDADRDRTTRIVRLHAGSKLPTHRHADVEEGYVLSGDLRWGDRQLGAGDYFRFAADSDHPEQWSENGCLILVTGATP